MIDDPPAQFRPPQPARRGPLIGLLVGMRPKQWTKNALLFAGLLFTLDKGHTAAQYGRVFLGFLLYCILSSAVYLINDVLDRESDRRHPRKCRRPIAAGDLSVQAALAAAALMTVGGLVCAFAMGREFGLITALYFALTALYSLYLKHVVIMDVLVLAVGYVLRAIAGAVLIAVMISPWLVLCTSMLALFLGLSKRRGELIATQQSGIGGTRRILDEYSAVMLDQMIVIVTSACLMSYALYTVESPAATRHHYLMATIPFVVYGIFRYLYLMHRHSLGEAPDAILLEDKPMLTNMLLWGVTTAVVVSHQFDRLAHLLAHG